MAGRIHHYTWTEQLPDAIFRGVEVLSEEYLVSKCTEEASERGVVEVVFDRRLMTRLMQHEGSHLLVLSNDECRVSSAPVVGVSVFFTEQSDFPEEAEDLAESLAEYSPFSWWFYVIVHPTCRGRGAMKLLVEESLNIIGQAGSKYVVADYMIEPTVCLAGKRLMELIGFQHTGRLYGNGLRQCGDDVYAISVREAAAPLPW